MRLTDADRTRVAAAVAEAERDTAGEIVTVVARRSDAYHDVALHWAVLAMLLVLALLALMPGVAVWLHGLVADPWDGAPAPGGLFTVALLLLAATFLIVRVILAYRPLRMALTPGSTAGRRVHARALTLFRASAEARTRDATGVLLYLSLDEHRAEIIADAAIHSRVTPDVWGAAMAALIAATRDGRPGDGMAEAVRQIGLVLAEHFPPRTDDTNELPDRLIEL
ncbi:TPM domain-containing protein [Sphingomonas sp. CLY1604]|uniref:TPM domain-containing protein n=1 Tax=Sphingomonas sp. CLY1604 TaxID=3457786 RepID=UPI003FD7131B